MGTCIFQIRSQNAAVEWLVVSTPIPFWGGSLVRSLTRTPAILTKAVCGFLQFLQANTRLVGLP